MLTGIYIQDIVLIDRLSLEIDGGLTALTGETGAGKSILLDALGLATGARAEKALIRQGAEQGIITASFEPTDQSEVWTVLEDNGLTLREGEPVILRRVQAADGRSRGFINDQPVSIALLRQVGEALIEVHGQHQGQGFLHVAAHRGLLDEFGGHDPFVTEVKQKWDGWQTALADLAQMKEKRQRAEGEADYLRHVVEELSQLAPKEGEETQLALQRSTQMASEKVAREIGDALTLLNDETMENRLSASIGRIDQASAHLADEVKLDLSKIINQMDQALTELQEGRANLQYIASQIHADEKALNQTEERLFAIRAAARKYNTSADQLSVVLSRARENLNLLDAGEENFEKQERKCKAAATAFQQVASELSNRRQSAARKLEKAVAKELAPLKLGNAKFSVELVTDVNKAHMGGIDKVQFLISTNPGAPAGPLKQIASGGELSRFVLAMKAALMAKENKTVIIFDEVDAGIGGAVADAVGERLAKLATGAQVMVITHSPQVAARAQTHFQVSKSGKKVVTTKIQRLGPTDRIEEIARMLAGAKITPEARAAAEKLLSPDVKAKTQKSVA
ncbi:MAG: DNA repair protein RecN [bacterium]